MNIEHYKKMIREQGLDENTYILGVDLGTTHSVISYWHQQKNAPEPVDMSNGFGKIPLPSVVQYRKDELDEEWIIGSEALNTYVIFPESTAISFKSLMGSNQVVSLNRQSFTPEELSAKVLRTLLDQIKSMNPKSNLAGIVVSVPYDFDDAAKKATINACHIAGIQEELICLIEEPKAAALTYNYHHPFKSGEKIMVFDFGGGTLDITLFGVEQVTDTEQTLSVLSEGGQAKHGGDVLDEILYGHFLEIIAQKGINLEHLSKENHAEIKMRARETKERLSGTQKIRIPFPFCTPPFVVNMTRDEFESIGLKFIEKTKTLVLKTLQEAYKGAIKAEEIDRVLLEGGSSQMPWIKAMMIQIFQDQNKIYLSDRPALDISLGATIYAAMKMGIHDQIELVTGRQRMNFEVCVPHDIGFEIELGDTKKFYTMISRGTPYRLARRSQVFTIEGDNEDDMTRLSVRILERIHKEQGLDGCSIIGDVEVSGLPKRPSGQTQLKVALSIDEESGTVQGEVEDLGYGNLYSPSGFKQGFIPKRHQKTLVIDER